MQQMFQKSSKNGPKSTPNPIKMGPGTPWVSIVKLRSELYGFWVLFGVPLWPYFLAFVGVIFQHFPQPLFDTVLEELWCYFGSVREAFLAHFGEPLKKWKFDSRCSGSTVFKVPGGPKITLFWFNYESTFWGTFLGHFLQILGQFGGSCGSPFGTLFPYWFLACFFTLFLAFLTTPPAINPHSAILSRTPSPSHSPS